MEDNFQVCFTPSGRQFKGEFGDTLLQVAQDAGVAIRSLCGGYGQCHQCWIEVSEGEHSKFGVNCKPENVTGVTKLEKQLIIDNPTYKGKRLACQSCIQGDLVIDFPKRVKSIKPTSVKKMQSRITQFQAQLVLLSALLKSQHLMKTLLHQKT